MYRWSMHLERIVYCRPSDLLSCTLQEKQKHMTYSSTMVLGRQQGITRGQNSVSFRSKDMRLGPVSNTIVLIVLACLLGLLYLTQVTKTNAYGYSINTLRQEQSELQSQRDDLAATSARLQSLDVARNSDEAKALVAAVPSGTVR